VIGWASRPPTSTSRSTPAAAARCARKDGPRCRAGCSSTRALGSRDSWHGVPREPRRRAFRQLPLATREPRPGDFPSLPAAPSRPGVGVPLTLLHALIDRTSFAVSTEEGHFQYNAALLRLGGKSSRWLRPTATARLREGRARREDGAVRAATAASKISTRSDGSRRRATRRFTSPGREPPVVPHGRPHAALARPRGALPQ